MTAELTLAEVAARPVSWVWRPPPGTVICLQQIGAVTAVVGWHTERRGTERKPRPPRQRTPLALQREARNDQLLADARAGMATAALADKYGVTRQRVSQVLRRGGVFRDEERSKRAAERQRQRAEVEELERLRERTKLCRVCGGWFVQKQRRQRECSRPCRLAWEIGRRYFDPAEYRKLSKFQHRAKEPNRRYVIPGSAVHRAILAVGREDLLPRASAKPAPGPHCAATNLNGTACNRGAAPDDSLCHIHRGAVARREARSA